jgi:hypothetical protein
MDLLVELLYAALLLVCLAATLISLGLVGLAFRWVVQVWRGGGSHRPYDMENEEAQRFVWLEKRPRERTKDQVDGHEII